MEFTQDTISKYRRNAKLISSRSHINTSMNYKVCLVDVKAQPFASIHENYGWNAEMNLIKFTQKFAIIGRWQQAWAWLKIYLTLGLHINKHLNTTCNTPNPCFSRTPVIKHSKFTCANVEHLIALLRILGVPGHF